MAGRLYGRVLGAPAVADALGRLGALDSASGKAKNYLHLR